MAAYRKYLLSMKTYSDNSNKIIGVLVGRVGFEPTTPAMSRLTDNNKNDIGCSGGAHWFESPSAHHCINWQQFNQFLLQRMNDKTAEDRLRYAKQYANVLLDSRDAQTLLALPPNKRIHVMKSLSCLARYSGRLSEWHSIRQKYGLTWSTGTEKIDAFTRLFDDSRSLETMIGWLKHAMQQLPKDYSDFFLFCTLTGLRCSECLAAVKLIKDSENCKTYYNESRQCLEHWRRPEIFIRRTKACYISIVDSQILSIAQGIEKTPTYNSLKMITKRKSPRLDMRIKYCRKIYSSWLRESRIHSEVVDMLSGRIGKNIFLRHYYTPSLQYKQDVLNAVHQLKKQIES